MIKLGQATGFGLGLGFSLTLACAGKPAGTSTASSPDGEKPGPNQSAEQCLADANDAHEAAEKAPSRINVSQILVRHAGVKQSDGVTRSREAACLRALAALNALKQGADWDQVVRDFSDAKSAELGWVRTEELQPKFAAAAFELDVNQLSYVVETDRGFHVILRIQ